MQGWAEGLDLGHLESGVLVTGVGDLVGGKNESVGGTVPRVLATKPSLGVATLNPQGPLWFTLGHVSDQECSFWCSQEVRHFPNPEPP